MDAIKFTSEQQTELYNWIKSHEDSNWGSWGNYPKVPGHPKFLQYDNAPVVVKFDQTVEFYNYRTGQTMHTRYISASRRCPGGGSDFVLASQIAPEDVVKDSKYQGAIHDYNRAKLAQATKTIWDSSREYERAQVNGIHEELESIKGTPNSKDRRNELEAKLLKLIRKPRLMTSWMLEALEFDSADDYANHKTNNL